jgi:hypothetical protein
MLHLFHKSIDYLSDELTNGHGRPPAGRATRELSRNLRCVFAVPASVPDAFARAFGDVIALPLGFGRTKSAANFFGEGGVAGVATADFAKHQPEGPSNKPLGKRLYR